MTETMVDVKVTYTLTFMGKIYIVEHVPARVCKETGEQYFAPDTVEHIQALIKSNKGPDKIIYTGSCSFSYRNSGAISAPLGQVSVWNAG